MTIRDLLNAGIQIQGHEIQVKMWSDRWCGYDMLHHSMEELTGVSEIVLDLEIKYIYAMDKTLVIEVEQE